MRFKVPFVLVLSSSRDLYIHWKPKHYRLTSSIPEDHQKDPLSSAGVWPHTLGDYAQTSHADDFVVTVFCGGATIFIY